MSVIGGVGNLNFVAGGIVSFIFGSAVIESGGAENLVSEVAMDSVAVVGLSACFGYFAEFVLMVPIPVFLHIFYIWRNLVPIYIFLSLVLGQHWGLPSLGVVALSLWGCLKWTQEGSASPSSIQTHFLTFSLLQAIGCLHGRDTFKLCGVAF